jgi:hypothetical protein
MPERPRRTRSPAVLGCPPGLKRQIPGVREASRTGVTAPTPLPSCPPEASGPARGLFWSVRRGLFFSLSTWRHERGPSEALTSCLLGSPEHASLMARQGPAACACVEASVERARVSALPGVATHIPRHQASAALRDLEVGTQRRERPPLCHLPDTDLTRTWHAGEDWGVVRASRVWS